MILVGHRGRKGRRVMMDHPVRKALREMTERPECKGHQAPKVSPDLPEPMALRDRRALKGRPVIRVARRVRKGQRVPPALMDHPAHKVRPAR